MKRLPIAYQGELHQVKLINFSVDADEIRERIPAAIPMWTEHGRALISMVNVQLHGMRPAGLPENLGAQYQHIGFRVLVNDAPAGGGTNRGIFFLQSFTDKPWVVRLGRQLTNYRLELGAIRDENYLFELQQGDRYLHYACTDLPVKTPQPELRQTVKAVDRAYATIGRQVFATVIERDGWPLEDLDCYFFETNFFETAQLEGAFRIRTVIPYRWNAPRQVVLPAVANKKPDCATTAPVRLQMH
ncbi:MAG: DUF2071 domain-containing protein [Bacteroidota bacterium]